MMNIVGMNSNYEIIVTPMEKNMTMTTNVNVMLIKVMTKMLLNMMMTNIMMTKMMMTNIINMLMENMTIILMAQAMEKRHAESLQQKRSFFVRMV